MKFFYVHGFASGENSSSFHNLKKLLGDVVCLTYDSSKPYKENLDNILTQFDTYCSKDLYENIVIGSSLGGYYAYSIPELYNHKCVLFNPVSNPRLQLSDKVGVHKNYSTGEDFWFSKEVLDTYEDVKPKLVPTITYVSENDEVLKNNVELSKIAYKNTNINITNTKHRIEDYSPYINDINTLAKSFIFF